MANIELIEREDLCRRSRTVGAELLSTTRDLFLRYLPGHVAEVRGIGMMVGIELVTDRETRRPALKLLRKLGIGLFRAGLMVKMSWDFHVMVFMPPLNISRGDLDEAMAILEHELRRVAR